MHIQLFVAHEVKSETQFLESHTKSVSFEHFTMQSIGDSTQAPLHLCYVSNYKKRVNKKKEYNIAEQASQEPQSTVHVVHVSVTLLHSPLPQ